MNFSKLRSDVAMGVYYVFLYPVGLVSQLMFAGGKPQFIYNYFNAVEKVMDKISAA